MKTIKKIYAALSVIATVVVIGSAFMLMEARDNDAEVARQVQQASEERDRTRAALNQNARDDAHILYAQMEKIAKIELDYLSKVGDAQAARQAYEQKLARLQKERDEKLAAVKD
jgi:hypothetical protein